MSEEEPRESKIAKDIKAAVDDIDAAFQALEKAGVALKNLHRLLKDRRDGKTG